MEKRRVVLFLIALLVALALPGAAWAACTSPAVLAKYDDEAAMLVNSGAFVQNSQWLGQSFLVPSARLLGGVSLFMENNAPTGDSVTAEIRSDAAGVPGAVLGQATASTTNTTSFDWLAFDFSALGLRLAGGTPYWIVAGNPITTNGQGYNWAIATPSTVYPDGISRASQTQGSTWNPPISGDFGFRVLGCAVPSNAFSFGAVARNERKGTAIIDLVLPNPGLLTALGNGASVASSTRAAVLSKSVPAGLAQLLVKAKGKKKRKLNKAGKVKLNIAVTYTPTDGDPSTQSVKVKLIKR